MGEVRREGGGEGEGGPIMPHGSRRRTEARGPGLIILSIHLPVPVSPILFSLSLSLCPCDVLYLEGVVLGEEEVVALEALVGAEVGHGHVAAGDARVVVQALQHAAHAVAAGHLPNHKG